MEVEEYIKKLIKVDGWRDPEFLLKRIKEKTGGSYEEAEIILKRIVEGDRSLRFVRVVARGIIGQVLPEGGQPKKTVIAYHAYLEPNGVYRGRKRGRPRDWQRDYYRLKNAGKHP